MATEGDGFSDDLFSTLMFGDNEELECFLADDLAGFRGRSENSHHSAQSTSSLSVIPYLLLIGDEDEAMLMAEEADSPKAPPSNAHHFINLDDVKVEKSGLVCSICLDEMSIGSRVKRLLCCHLYHGNCIEEWLKKTNTCPICRHEVPVIDR